MRLFRWRSVVDALHPASRFANSGTYIALRRKHWCCQSIPHRRSGLKKISCQQSRDFNQLGRRGSGSRCDDNQSMDYRKLSTISSVCASRFRFKSIFLPEFVFSASAFMETHAKIPRIDSYSFTTKQPQHRIFRIVVGSGYTRCRPTRRFRSYSLDVILGILDPSRPTPPMRPFCDA
jgi:hypothetical protein